MKDPITPDGPKTPAQWVPMFLAMLATTGDVGVACFHGHVTEAEVDAIRGPLAPVSDFFSSLAKSLTPASGDESGGVSADDPVGSNPVRAALNTVASPTQQPVADPMTAPRVGFNSGSSITAPPAPKLPLFAGLDSSASTIPSGTGMSAATGATPNPVSTPNPPAVAGAPKPVDPLGAFAPKLAPTPVSLANNNPSLDPNDLLKKQKQPLFAGL